MLKEYMKEFGLDFVALFETRISGCKVESVIAKLGFTRSYRVEAEEFAGGIWVLWNDDSNVDVLSIHPQFVHMRI